MHRYLPADARQADDAFGALFRKCQLLAASRGLMLFTARISNLRPRHCRVPAARKALTKLHVQTQILGLTHDQR
jgi:hypothetical protein